MKQWAKEFSLLSRKINGIKYSTLMAITIRVANITSSCLSLKEMETQPF